MMEVDEEALFRFLPAASPGVMNFFFSTAIIESVETWPKESCHVSNSI